MSRSPGKIIISNNPLIFDRFHDAVSVEGGPCEVFKEALNLLDGGHALTGHALAGSVRLCCNPYRSLVLEPSFEGFVDEVGIKVILDAIERVDAAVRTRPVPVDMKSDYAVMDLELLESQFAG